MGNCKRLIIRSLLISFVSLIIIIIKANLSYGAQTLQVQTKNALTGSNLGTGLAGAAYDPAGNDSLIANNSSDPTGIITLFLEDGAVNTQETSWGAIKSRFKQPNILKANKASTAAASIDPFNAVRLFVYGPGFANYNNPNVPLADGENYVDVMMIPNTGIAYPYQTTTPGGTFTINTLVEMLKNATRTFDSGTEQTLEGIYWPIDIVGWDVNDSPDYFTAEQIQNWMQSWQEAETDWETNTGYNLITLVPEGQTATSGTVWNVMYLPSSQVGGFEEVNTMHEGNYISGGYTLVSSSVAGSDDQQRLCLTEHMFGHMFGLSHVGNDNYLMNGDIGNRTVTQDEGDLVEVIYNIAPTNMSNYETPEHD